LSLVADSRIEADAYDGVSTHDLARRLGVPQVIVFETIGSTLDVAHERAAAGATAGTLVLADEQTAGRGRHGRAWRSEPAAGVWLTIIERPRDIVALEVLTIRIGLTLAVVLDSFATGVVGLKWPNDLYIGAKKLGGILVEARWREGIPEWAAIGVGINVRSPHGEPHGVGLRAGTERLAVVEAVVVAIRDAARRSGSLTAGELDAFAARDMAAGRTCIEPTSGRVRGIDASGALLVDVGSHVHRIRAGSLVLREEGGQS
jgi:BirA family transcriptional regulator, biotin operon repressor / biotin---[acetyl-CoA-carboxylase] ligase